MSPLILEATEQPSWTKKRKNKQKETKKKKNRAFKTIVSSLDSGAYHMESQKTKKKKKEEKTEKQKPGHRIEKTGLWIEKTN